MRFNFLAVAGLLLSAVALAAPVDLSARSDELIEDILFAREPIGPSRIPRYVGAAGIRQPKVPTPNAMSYLNNRRPNTLPPPYTSSPPPPYTPFPRPARPLSRIPIMSGSNLGKRSDELD